MAATNHNPAKLAPAGLMVTNVMPYVRQPREVAGLAPQWDALGRAGGIGEVPQLCAIVCDCEHPFRRFDPDDLRLEYSGEQRREPARACAKVKNSETSARPYEGCQDCGPGMSGFFGECSPGLI